MNDTQPTQYKERDATAPLPPRLQQELRTIEAMIKIYCGNHHKAATSQLCDQCIDLLKYAGKRLANCPFQANKPTCGNCTVHCYKKEMRDKVKEVMKYSGPKMIWRHPLLALKHLFDSARTVADVSVSPTIRK